MTTDLTPAALAPGIPFPVVVVAASAGGPAALTRLLGALPADFPAAVIVVQHLDPQRPSHLAEILARRTPLPVRLVEEGDCLRPGTVFIAPPNDHLLVNPDGTLTLARTERLHFVRPSADRLFETAATSCGGRAIAVVLTGTGSDGTGGVRAVKRQGGTVIAQDRDSADFFGMPWAAIETGSVDLVLPLEQIAPTLVGLVARGGAP